MATWVQDASAETDGLDYTSLSCTVSATTAGSLLVAFLKWEGNNQTLTVTEGTGAFTNGTKQQYTGIDLWGQFAYKLVAEGGDTTIVASWGGTGVTWAGMIVFEYSYTGTAAFDAQIASSQGNSTTPTTTNWTVSSDAQVVLTGLAKYGSRTITAGTADINSVDADHVEPSAATSEAYHAWDRVISSGFTGAGTATISSAVQWLCNGISFNVTGGAAGQPTVKRWGGVKNMAGPGRYSGGRIW